MMNDEVDYEAENKRQAEDDKRAREREINDINKVLSMPEGRRVIWRLLGETGVFRGSFDENSQKMAFAEGRRDIGLLYFGEIMANNPGAYAQMQREATGEQKQQGKGKK